MVKALVVVVAVVVAVVVVVVVMVHLPPGGATRGTTGPTSCTGTGPGTATGCGTSGCQQASCATGSNPPLQDDEDYSCPTVDSCLDRERALTFARVYPEAIAGQGPQSKSFPGSPYFCLMKSARIRITSINTRSLLPL